MDRYKNKTLLTLLSPYLPVLSIYAKKSKEVTKVGFLSSWIWLTNHCKIINSLTDISMKALSASPNRISTCRLGMVFSLLLLLVFR